MIPEGIKGVWSLQGSVEDDGQASPTLRRYFVHGNTYIDERAVMHNGDADEGDDYYYLLRELYTVDGLVNNTDREVERYRHDAYGPVEITSCKRGDVDYDGYVSTMDSGAVASCYGSACTGSCPPWMGDYDGDGYIGTLDSGAIEAEYGAALEDVIVEGNVGKRDDPMLQTIVVPNGQSGIISQTITNEGVIAVGELGESTPTFLIPSPLMGVTLSTVSGNGRVEMKNTFARLGDFTGVVTNGPGHHIDGAGIIFGGLVNYGVIRANMPGQELQLFPFGTQINDGSFIATNGGLLRISTEIGGTGGYTADNGTIKLTPDGGFAVISGSTLDITSGGVVDVDRAVSVELTGPMTVHADGTFRADPDAIDPVSATLEAGSITIMESTLGGAPGSMILTDSMSVASNGNLILDGTNSGSCQRGRSDTPPILRVPGTSQVFVGADLQLVHSVELFVGSSAQMTIGGGFSNQSVYAECFDCLEGTLLLSGAAPQALEIAGEDRGADPAGFDENFAMGTVELEVDVVVDIVDVFDNQQDGHTGCDEVLYVDTLILHAGAVLNTDGCTVYYNNLQNSGGSIPGLGSEVLNIAGADVDDDGDVDLDDYSGFADCFAGPGETPDPTPPLMAQKCLDRFDANHDFDLDLSDYGNFQSLFGGEG